MMRLALILGLVVVLSGIGSGIYVAGKRATRAEYAERDNLALKAAYKARDEAIAKVSDLERQRAADMGELERKTEKESEDAKVQLQSALAGVAAGKLRLRNLARSCTGATPASPGAEARPPPGAVAGGTPPRLPGADEEFLVRFASECDQVAIERNEAVSIARRDRE